MINECLVLNKTFILSPLSFRDYCKSGNRENVRAAREEKDGEMSYFGQDMVIAIRSS